MTGKPISGSPLLKRLALVAALAAGIGACLYFVDPSTAWFAPKCPVKLLTGLSCPACGVQRFVHALLCGRPLDAVRFNFWLALMLPYAAAFLVAWLMPERRAKKRLVSVIEHPAMVYTYIAVMAVWMIVRNVAGI